MRTRIFLAIILTFGVIALWQTAVSQSSMSGPFGPVIFGSTTVVSPPRFNCPNDNSTGTTLNEVIVLSAQNTCINATTSNADPTTPAAVMGVCVGNCSTSGAAAIAVGGVVPCLFDNATTFGHAVVLSRLTAANCKDTGGSFYNPANPASYGLGRVLDTGAAGVHNVIWQPVVNPFNFGDFVGNTDQLNMTSFAGQFLFRSAAAGSPFLQIGGVTTSFPCMTNSGAQLKVVLAGSNCAGSGANGDGPLGVGHLASNNSAPPTIMSGFGTTPSIVSGGDTAFIVNVGTGGAATSGVVSFGVAYTTAPSCISEDVTNNHETRAVAATGTVTLTTSSAWAASDKVSVVCFGQNGL